MHPNTDNQRLDHMVRALWLGPQLHIHGDFLSEEPLDNDEQDPNTEPSIPL